MRIRVTVISQLFLLVTTEVAFGDDVPVRRSLNLPGVREHFDVRYLPAHRYTGDTTPRGDAEMTLDVYVPAAGGRHPCVIYVHGGGYGGGSKRIDKSNRELVKRLLAKGYTVVSLNYILHPKGIFPQVWWDFHDAVRFLRKHADEYHIDPLRIGAYGLSAGGWLVSSASVGNGDLLRRNNGSAVSIVELKQQNWKLRVKRPDEDDNWLRPMRSPSSAWPGAHGGVSALSFDFDHYMQHAAPHNPSFQKWAGMGFTPRYWTAMVESGAAANLEFARMTSDGFKGKAVHVPPFYPGSEKDRNKALARSADGGEAPLGDLVQEFFDRHLVKECRLPAPEIFPIPRVFSKRTKVSMVAPPGAVIHYTTDGSEPNTSAPRYDSAFEITHDTVVKAIAVRDGFITSGTNSAHFVTGPPPPSITGPLTLPPAKTGEPYRVEFRADSANARWMLQGDLVPHNSRKSENFAYPNSMTLDSQTGVWSGTPAKPGRYWIQVWVNTGDGTVAVHRDYRWEVVGEPLPEDIWSNDANTTRIAKLITNDGWSKGLRAELQKRLTRRGVKCRLTGMKDEDRLLIVPRADADKAGQLLSSFTERYKKLREKTQHLGDSARHD